MACDDQYLHITECLAVCSSKRESMHLQHAWRVCLNQGGVKLHLRGELDWTSLWRIQEMVGMEIRKLKIDERMRTSVII